MTTTCIVTADASRARLFTFEEPVGDDDRSLELCERMDLIDPARRRRPSELFSESRPGLDRAPSGRGFAVDDHREGNRKHMDREFAAEIASALDGLARARGCSRLILAASPRMLGLLREIEPLAGRAVEVCEIDRDLVHLTGAQLHDYLADRGLLPRRERLAAAAPP